MKKYKNHCRKCVAICLAVLLIIPSTFISISPVSAKAIETQNFKDVKKTDYYYEAVQSLSTRTIINGYKDGTYRPNQAVTRAQAAAILTMSLGLDTKNVQNPNFKDVEQTDWYYQSVAAVVQAGIMNGYDKKTFKPNTKLTRAQTAKIITKAYRFGKKALVNNPFKDVKKDDWFAQFLSVLIEKGITKGTTATTFSPNHSVTRGQLAVFVYKSEMASKVVKSEVLNITNTSVELRAGTYPLTDNLKDWLNPTNLAVLKGAIIQLDAEKSTIKKVESLTLKASGSTSEDATSPFKNHLILNGKGANFEGSLIVNGDYISIKNLTINEDLIIGKEVQNSIYLENVTVKGKTVVSDTEQKVSVLNQAVASLDNVAITSTVPVLYFQNVNLQSFEINRNERIIVEIKGSTSVLSWNLLSKVTLKVEPGMIIENIIIPNGLKLEDIIINSVEIKKMIKKINGVDNPNFVPSTPPSGGGGGGGASDVTPPTVTGVIDGEEYNIDVTPVFTEGTATLSVNGGTATTFTSGTIISAEGSYVLVAKDSVGNAITIDFKIDKTQPVVTGVIEGKIYNIDVTPVFTEGTALLIKNNSTSKQLLSGTTVSADGSYQLIVSDKAGNTTVYNFNIDKTAPIISGVTNGGLYNINVSPTYNEGTGWLSKNGGSESIYYLNFHGPISAEGSYVLRVRDSAGNTTTVSFRIDKTPPTVTGVANGTSYSTNVTPEFTEGIATLSTNGGTPESFTTGTELTAEGSYTLVVTDEAGNANTIHFTIDRTNPVLSAGSTENVMSTSIDIRITSSEAAKVYYVVVPQGSAVPTDAEVKAGGNYRDVTVVTSGSFDVLQGENIKNITGLTPVQDYAIYTLAEDPVALLSNVLEITSGVHTLVDAALNNSVLLASDVNSSTNNTLTLTISGATFTAGAGNPIAISSLSGTASNAVVNVVQDATDPSKAVVTVTNNGTSVNKGETITFNVVTTNLTGTTETTPVTITLASGLVLGGSSHVSVPGYNKINFSGQSDYTIAAWIRPAGNGSIFSKFRGNDDRWRTQIALSYDQNRQDVLFKLDDYNGDGWQNFGGNSPNVPLNEWTHIAIVKSGTQISMYKNGILDANNSGTLEGWRYYSTVSLGEAIIGGGFSGDFNGSIDEFFIWDKALNADAITDVMNNQFNISDPNLAGYFPFNEKTGTTTSNDAPVGNDGTLSSSTIWGVGKY